jgi:hypothetical protein
MNNSELTKKLRQSANKISSKNISQTETDTVLTDIKVSLKKYKKTQNKLFWEMSLKYLEYKGWRVFI